MSQYVVHVLITHVHYTVGTVKIVNVDHVLAINVAHQQLKLRKGSSRSSALRRLESEEAGDWYTRINRLHL